MKLDKERCRQSFNSFDFKFSSWHLTPYCDVYLISSCGTSLYALILHFLTDFHGGISKNLYCNEMNMEDMVNGRIFTDIFYVDNKFAVNLVRNKV